MINLNVWLVPDTLKSASNELVHILDDLYSRKFVIAMFVVSEFHCL